jgi:hypothetical protein
MYRWLSALTNFDQGFFAYLCSQGRTRLVSLRSQRAKGKAWRGRKNAPAEDVVELGRELDVVLLEVLVQLVRAEDLGDLDQLVLCSKATA